MANCEIILKINGVELEPFHSDRDLDGWIYDHRDSLSFDGKDITFSIKTPQQVAHETVANTIALAADFKNGKVIDVLKKQAVYTSPTSFTKYGGLAQDINGRTLWVKPIYPIKKQTEPTNPIEKEFQDLKMDIGNDFDVMMDYALGKTTSITTKIMRTGSKQYNSMLSVAESVASKLKSDHPGALFLTQVSIATANITSSFQDSLRLALSGAEPEFYFGGSVNEINAFLGKPDLIVIDSDGSVSVYDFKTSEGLVTIENHPEYKIQIATYAQMLKQHGLKIKNVGLIPVQVKYVSRDPLQKQHCVSDKNGFTLNNFSMINAGDTIWRDVMEKWIPTTIETNYGELKDLQNVLNVVAPNTSITKQAEFRSLQVDTEMARVFNITNSSEKAKGNTLQYECLGTKEGDDHYLYAKDNEEMRKKIEKWVETYNKRAAETFTNFAIDLRKVLLSRSTNNLREIAKTYNAKNQTFIVTMFRRYINGWELISDDTMIANGLFLFQNKDLIELVVLDSKNPYSKVKWDHANTVRKWTTVLGHFKADDEYVDKRWVLQNFQGNLAMMKGMIFLAQHPNLFQHAKLNKVSTMSLGHNALIEESLEKLVENYHLMAAEYQKQTGEYLNLLTIGKEVNSDATASVNIALDLLRNIPDEDIHNMLEYKSPFKDLPDNVEYSTGQIRQMIYTLHNATNNRFRTPEDLKFDDERARAITFLYRAWLAKTGYQISPEESTGKYTHSGPNFNGLYATSFADSPSAIARTIHEAVYSFTRVCQNEYVRYTANWKRLIKKLYKEHNVDETIGGTWNFFERFFKKDGDSNKISSKFMLKPRGSMDSATENAVLDMFYDALDRFQYYKGFVSEEKFIKNKQAAIENGTYGEVPLIKPSLVEGAEKMGTIKAIMQKAETDWNIMRDFLLSVDVSDAALNRLGDINASRIPALVFENEDREKKLNESENAVDKYTTDLDFIFNMIVAQGLKRALSPQILMTTTAIRGVLANTMFLGADKSNNNDLEKTQGAIIDYIKTKLFNQPIMDKGELRLKRVVDLVKGMTSFITLGANFRAFTREMITGIERFWLRFEFKPEYKDVVNSKDYFEALNELITQCTKNTDVMSFHMQLNQLFGTANFSYDQMAEASKVIQWSIKDFSLNDLYFTATWPDFIHRNAIVIAYLKGVGAYEAYSLKDDILTYDMKKDQRFRLFNKYRKREDVPKSEIMRWDKEREIYDAEFNSWVKNNYHKPDGTELQYGDDLPQALSPRTVLGLKDMADRLYGNYDKETKSLMMSQLLGSMFFQFRTYGLMRLRELFDGGSSTSDIRMVPIKVKNTKGEEVDAYAVPENPSTLSTEEKMTWTMKPVNEITPDDIQHGAHRMLYSSSYYSAPGQIQTLVDLGASLFWHKNQEEFNYLWNSCPDYRANVTLFMIDTFGMLLLALLINALYGEAMTGDYNEIDWFTKWSYAVAVGVANEGPVWQVVSSVIGNGAPPMLSVLQSFSSNAWSTITGKKNFLEGIANTFGATRELAYLFRTT